MPECPHGHEMTGDNVIVYGNKKRACRSCKNSVPHRKRHDIGAAEDLPALVLRLLQHLLLDNID